MLVASAPIPVPIVPAETEASARSAFAVGSGLNDSVWVASGEIRKLAVTIWRTFAAREGTTSDEIWFARSAPLIRKLVETVTTG